MPPTFESSSSTEYKERRRSHCLFLLPKVDDEEGNVAVAEIDNFWGVPAFGEVIVDGVVLDAAVVVRHGPHAKKSEICETYIMGVLLESI